MKLIFRNFWNTIKHYRQSSLFNIIGLTLAFTACYLIYIQANYDFSFGKVHNDHERIYRFNVEVEGATAALGCLTVKRLLDNQSGVESSTLIPFFGTGTKLEVEKNGEIVNILNKLCRIDTCINNIFEFDMIKGSMDNLMASNTAIIPLSLAENIFNGAENAIGQKLFSNTDKEKSYNIIGVYKDFSNLSVISNDIYVFYNYEYNAKFNGFNEHLYFKVYSGTNLDELGKTISNQLNAELANLLGGITVDYSFTPLDEVYFEKMSHVSHEIGNKTVTISLIFVAILILIIATINFVNFSIAIAPRRIKAINTYRVLGHSLAGLRLMIIMEAIFTTIISFILSLIVVQLISSTYFASLISTSILLLDNISSLVVVFIASLTIGAIAGLYPAFHITSFVPALVLNGGKSLPKSALRIREVLISFQYIISISMIIISIFINLQNQFMFNKDYGYDIENILEVEFSKNHQLVTDELLNRCPYIKDITFSFSSIIDGTYSTYTAESKKDGHSGMYDVLAVNYNYPKIMGFEIIEGEDFVELDMNAKEETYALFNETAKEVYDLEVGQRLYMNNIVVKGFFKDVNHKSLHSPITPFALMVGTGWKRTTIIKYLGEQNLPKLIGDIKEVVAEKNNGEIPDINTADQSRYNAYKKDADLNILITWATILAILISIIGVVGLISLESQYRIREIAIRKVNGASTGNILKMLNTKFIKIVVICYIIAVPLSWYVVNQWLNGFEYRVDMSAWVFIVAGVFTLLLTTALVTIQSYRAATTNPARAMKY